MSSLDTNAILRWLIGDVPEQTDRVLTLVRSGQPIFVDELALIEVVYVLERRLKLNRTLIADAIGVVSSIAAIQFDRDLWRDALATYVAHTKLSITDICLVRRAAERGTLPVLTFDRKLASQLDGAELL